MDCLSDLEAREIQISTLSEMLSPLLCCSLGNLSQGLQGCAGGSQERSRSSSRQFYRRCFPLGDKVWGINYRINFRPALSSPTPAFPRCFLRKRALHTQTVVPLVLFIRVPLVSSIIHCEAIPLSLGRMNLLLILWKTSLWENIPSPHRLGELGELAGRSWG